MFVVAAGISPEAVAEPPDAATAGTVRAAHISAALGEIPVSGAAYEQAVAAMERTRADLEADETRLREATTRIGTLTVERGRLERAIDSDEAVKAEADRKIATLRTQLRHLALQAYVGADDRSSTEAALTLDTDVFLQARKAVTMRRAVTESSHERYERQVAVSTAAGERLERNRAARLQAIADLESSSAEADAARQGIERGRVALTDRLVELRDARAVAFVDGTDLPLVALDAYVHADRIARLTTPGCHLHWSLLAGIGKIESGQGTHGGASVRQDGTLTRPIIGIPLDGNNGTETIVDADGGFMRAQGPMQFLPSTWASIAIDGDDDDRTDIQNLYDAAASAGAYLCRNGVDLATAAGLRRAILSYNFSGDYVGKVIRAMNDYAEALPSAPRD
ncbi:MAG TPA: lytic murein transglycosylase [Acidimicrobiales bacterium]|nr:lytic murein transglycosylase [Acidimicrobiales bacterium]